MNKTGIPEWQTRVIQNEDDSMGLRTFLNDIRSLDTIQLLPRAMFPGWTNFVLRAEIEVHCAKSVSLLEASPLLGLHYDKLDSEGQDIYLLELLPGCGGQAICVKFTAVDLLDSGYAHLVALLYRWGLW